jgi:beta-glucosidase
VDLDPSPLFPFGFGLSYTTFDYANLRLSAKEIDAGGSVDVAVDVRNSGRRSGTETVQLYVRDVVSSVSTPVMRLRGFCRASLEPGAGKTVTFHLGPADLALLDERLRRVVEPGEFEVRIGAPSSDIRLAGTFVVRAGSEEH